MRCRLCGVEGELRSSHIVPELAFKPLYDERHGAVEHTISNGKSRIIRKGYRERLLCGDCESRVGRFETKFAERWVQQSPLPQPITASEYLIAEIDYREFKLFHLSVLWRASVSARSEFRLVNLGPYEAILRSRLLAEDAGEAEDFAIMATALIDPRTGLLERAIYIEPERVRRNHGSVYIFTFSGFSWFYFVGSSVPSDLAPGILSTAGSLLVDTKSFFEYKPLVRSFARLQSARQEGP